MICRDMHAATLTIRAREALSFSKRTLQNCKLVVLLLRRHAREDDHLTARGKGGGHILESNFCLHIMHIMQSSIASTFREEAVQFCACHARWTSVDSYILCTMMGITICRHVRRHVAICSRHARRRTLRIVLYLNVHHHGSGSRTG